MNILQLTTTVLGGLALFIYGMGLMSEGLTQIAGARMKAVLGYVTRNRVFAILAGAGVTALIQSSSATTVMTVGFVNAGLLSLQQAIGVVFGANIGTTMTGQLVSFNLTDIALPAVVVGVAGTMAARRLRTRAFWRAVLGFGLLFFGMNMMSHELKSLAKLPEFVRVFSVFDCAPSAAGYLPLGTYPALELSEGTWHGYVWVTFRYEEQTFWAVLLEDRDRLIDAPPAADCTECEEALEQLRRRVENALALMEQALDALEEA